MASDLKRTRSDTQSYTAQGLRNPAMSNATYCGYSSNYGLDFSNYQGSSTSYHSRHTAQEIPSCGLQQRTPFSGPLAPLPRMYVAPGELSNKIDPSYESILTSRGYTASSSTENGRQAGTESYSRQSWQYPFMVEHQDWQQNLGYSGQQTFFEGSYQHSSQPMQSGSYPTNSENSRQPQQYNPSFVPPSYLYNNRMPSIASPGSSSYLSSIMAATRPRIVVDKAQDDPISSLGDDQSSIYQACLGTDIVSASRREASVGLNKQHSSIRTPRRSRRARNNMIEASHLEEAAEGKLSVPRTPRRRQSEDDSQRRRRHLTPEGREHAREVRKLHACTECRRRKIKCKHVLESDLVSKPSSPGLQGDAYTLPCSSSSASSSGYPSPGIVESPLFQAAMDDFPYCQSPTPLPRAYTEPTYRDTIVDINRHNANPYRGTDPYVFRKLL